MIAAHVEFPGYGIVAAYRINKKMPRPPPCGTLTPVPTIGNPTLQPYELFIGLRYTRAKRRTISSPLSR